MNYKPGEMILGIFFDRFGGSINICLILYNKVAVDVYNDEKVVFIGTTKNTKSWIDDYIILDNKTTREKTYER